MKKFIKYMILLLVLLIAVVLMTSCTYKTAGKVTGGGWFIDVHSGNKCTFGFNAHGEGDFCEGFEFKGQFQFNDHAGNKIHAEVMELREIILVEDVLVFGGEDDEGKEVWVRVKDLGQPGADAGDEIRIWYDSNPYFNEPTWKGELGGGNIKIH